MSVATTTAGDASSTGFLSLPNELIVAICQSVPALQLISLALTCRRLRLIAYDDQLWGPRVNENLPNPLQDPAPATSFRELFAAHHPHWFLTKHRFWFADTEPCGKLLVARYNPSRGSIEAHAVTALVRRNMDDLEDEWEFDPDVFIHRFEPVVSLDLRQPVLRLDLERPLTADEMTEAPREQYRSRSPFYHREVLMRTFSDAGLYSSFMLCRRLPELAISSGTQVWPPLRFPTETRTRNMTQDGYASAGHRPTRLSEVSQYNFRVRKWVEYTGRRMPTSFHSRNGLSAALGLNDAAFGPPFISSFRSGINVRMPEDLTTFAALPEEVYMPTPQKPWQGVWVGDYSAHGCEFLLVLQPDKDKEKPLPEGLELLPFWPQRDQSSDSIDSSVGSFTSAQEEVENSSDTEDLSMQNNEAQDGAAGVEDARSSEAAQQMSESDVSTKAEQSHPPSGRLEAIKLTGDPNIPRGQYTWIAPEIGPEGLIRIADEAPFKGARIVQSAGHIAAPGFLDDQYTLSQLIMVSHNTLAQFWAAFGHISYYHRLDLNALVALQTTSQPRPSR